MRKFYWLAMVSVFLFSCQEEDHPDPENNKTAVVEQYADMVLANYQDAYAQVLALRESIDAFASNPTREGLEATKQAWLAAREPYGQTEVFRFYGGPIDDEDGPEGELNAWPLDESYIDYVEGNVNGANPNAGINIIGDPAGFPEINPSVIASLNENGGETNISSGYHAIEFLLWGQDQSPGPGGGQRPYTDYLPLDAGCTHGHCDRRGAYLQAVTALLVDDLQSLVDAWKEGSSYRTFFTSEAEIDNSLERILTGMGKLSKGELAGERMYVAWDEKSKEDEHSCFSDNTHRDIVNNAKGIQNVYVGKYVATDGTVTEGPGLDELVAAQNAALNQEMLELLDQSVAATEAIKAPFDQEILAEPGRTRIKTAIDLLREQGDKISEISALFGFALDPSDV